MVVTILRLPHMDIVMNSDNSEEEEGEKQEVILRRSTRQKRQKIILRRSTRNRDHGRELGEEKLEEENIGRLKRSRMRYNSVMDEDEEEVEPDDEKGPKRKEPDHRRQNRMRQENVSVSIWLTSKS